MIVVDFMQARHQPESFEEERILQEKYGNMKDLEERAFRILVNSSMVDLHFHPAKDLMLDLEDDH